MFQANVRILTEIDKTKIRLDTAVYIRDKYLSVIDHYEEVSHLHMPCSFVRRYYLMNWFVQLAIHAEYEVELGTCVIINCMIDLAARSTRWNAQHDSSDPIVAESVSSWSVDRDRIVVGSLCICSWV